MTTVIQGSTVNLTITRAPIWVTVFSDRGSDSYQSPPFTVPGTWRIQYRVDATTAYAFVFTKYSWGASFESGSFYAQSPGALHVYNPSDGAGTYRISVDPSSDTTWYFEIDALK